MREHSCRRGLAISASHRGNRYATRRTWWVKHIEHLACDIARLALTRRHVHAEARARIDFDDGAADVFIRVCNIIGEKVHPANIETYRTHRTNCHFAVVRVHHVGQIDGSSPGRQVSGSAEEELLIFFQHRFFIIAGICHQAFRLRIDFEAG